MINSGPESRLTLRRTSAKVQQPGRAEFLISRHTSDGSVAVSAARASRWPSSPQRQPSRVPASPPLIRRLGARKAARPVPSGPRWETIWRCRRRRTPASIIVPSLPTMQRGRPTAVQFDSPSLPSPFNSFYLAIRKSLLFFCPSRSPSPLIETCHFHIKARSLHQKAIPFVRRS